MNRIFWPLTAFVLALCSLSYEFVMIKTLTATLGGRIFNYNLVVSIFTFSLGLGSLYSDHLSQKKQNSQLKKNLGNVELVLASLGIGGPILLLAFPNLLLGLSISFLIGLLSGLELPLLFKLSPLRDSKLIAFDFLGMFAAALLIPLIFFRQIGLFPTAFIIGCLNLSIALFLLENKYRKYLIPTLCFCACFVLGNYHVEIHDVLRKLFLWGALS